MLCLSHHGCTNLNKKTKKDNLNPSSFFESFIILTLKHAVFSIDKNSRKFILLHHNKLQGNIISILNYKNPQI